MTTKYPIVETFYSIQGEGYHSGRAAYFIRLGGCDVRCSWCDAKESWSAAQHPMVDAKQIVEQLVESGARTAVVTGGEPALHDMRALCDALHGADIEVLLESSGSRPILGSFDWICISPKRAKPPIDQALKIANELKVVIGSSDDFEWAEGYAKEVGEGCRLYLQPEWSVAQQIMPQIVEYVKAEPRWQISIQSHKYMQIP